MEKRFGHLRKQLLNTGRSDLFVGKLGRGAAKNLLELCKNRGQKCLALGTNLAVCNETLKHLTENSHLL
jgi:hypothetical protein